MPHVRISLYYAVQHLLNNLKANIQVNLVRLWLEEKKIGFNLNLKICLISNKTLEIDALENKSDQK